MYPFKSIEIDDIILYYTFPKNKNSDKVKNRSTKYHLGQPRNAIWYAIYVDQSVRYPSE